MNCKRHLKSILLLISFCLISSLFFHSMLTWAGDASFNVETQYNGANWMSGIADGRYLHEINIPGAHDACTKDVWASHVYSKFYYGFAITQVQTITELLNSGVRMFDLRVTNCRRHISNAKPNTLYLCHGEYQMDGFVDGLNYCVNDENALITLPSVLEDVETWLMEHPTETVLIELKSEYDDKENDNELRDVYDTLKDVLNENKWIYTGTAIPKLGDVRGKGVLLTSHVERMGCGLNTTPDSSGDVNQLNGTRLCYENHYEYDPEPKKEVVEQFYSDHQDKLKAELSSSVSDTPLYYVMTSSNHWKILGGQTPKAVAEVVNPSVYGVGGLFIDRASKGLKLGWVYSDYVVAAANKQHYASANIVWQSNYPGYFSENYTLTDADGKGYYHTLTYEDGNGTILGTQHVLKGASVVLPSYTMTDFAGWAVKDNPDEIHQGKFTPNSDMTLIPAAGMTWASFQTWVTQHAGQDVSFTLTKDLIAGSEDKTIQLPKNTTIHLNLNGHNITAPDSEMAFNLVKWESNLYITGPGTINGGKNVRDLAGVIAISNKCSASLDNVKVTGASNPSGAAAIRLLFGGSLSLKDTTVTDNSGYYGAIWLMQRATMTVCGHTIISGNHITRTANRSTGDVYMAYGSKIGFTGKLADDAQIVITMNKPGESPQFTEGFGKWHEKAPSDYFSYANDEYNIDIMHDDNDQVEGVVTDHTHHYKVTADGSRLTLQCTSSCCTLHKPITIELCKPKHSIYTDGLDCNAYCINLTDEIKPVITYKKGDQILSEAPSEAGTYTAIMTVTDASGSDVSASIDYTIYPRPVSVSGIRAKDKIYDGTTTAELETDCVRIDGVKRGDDVRLAEVAGAFESSDAGRQNVILNGFRLGGTSASNYTLDGAVQQLIAPAEIYKKNQQTPDEPGTTSVANHSITLKAQDGCEYRCDYGDWQESTTFTGLASGTEYEFTQRLKGDANHNPSAESDGLKVTTTAYEWVYSVEDNKIKATCESGSGQQEAVLELHAPTLEIYGQTGDDISEEASLTVIGDVDTIGDPEVDYYNAEQINHNSASGSQSSVRNQTTFTIQADSSVQYEKRGNELESAPSDAGDYIAEVVLRNVRTSADDTTKHDVSVSVGYTIAKASRTISFPVSVVNKTYGDAPFINRLNNTGTGTVVYSVINGSTDSSDVAAVDSETGEVTIKGAGTVTIQATVTDDTNCIYSESSKTYTLTVSQSAARILSAPEAKELVYTGNPQNLVTAGATADGTMQYASASASASPSDWSDTIPQGTTAGEYYVWYRVSPDGNHTDGVAKCVTVTIDPVDKSELTQEILYAEELYNSYSGSSDLAATLSSEIAEAKGVEENENATADDVNSALDDLIIAEISFVLDQLDEDDEEAANKVIERIDEIGEVTYDQACKDRIDAARNAYDGLTSYQQDLVINDGQLFEAERRFEELKKQAGTKKTEAVAKTKDTPQPIVEGLDKIITPGQGSITPKQEQEIKDGEISIQVQLLAERKDETTAAGSQEIKNCIAEGTNVQLYLDLSLLLTVTENLSGDAGTIDIGSENKVVLGIRIPYDTARQNIQVLRCHKGAVQTFNRLEEEPAEPFADGTFFIGDNYITLYASGFSTYAIADSGMTQTTPETGTEQPETTPESEAGQPETTPGDGTAQPQTGSASAGQTAVKQETFIAVTKVRHTKNKIELAWKPVTGAEGYDIFASFATGKLQSVPVSSVAGSRAVIKKVYKKSRLSKVTDDCIIYLIRAYRTIGGQKSYIAQSYKNHTVGQYHNRYSDARNIVLDRNSFTVSAGMTVNLKAKVKTFSGGKQAKGAKALRYLSSDSAVAAVNGKGRILAVGKGSCYIYVTAASGLTKIVLVNVA